ncbi:hypothetical protein BD560DRAFT_213174 [Blakeslea trispora]|nr:hypothetical protein BD560DRAFT_213174 [Blakeslea trispora]
MLVGNTRNASPTSVPLPPVKLPNPYNQPRRADRHQEKTYSSAIIASCCILCGLFIAILFWFCRKRRWLTFQKAKQGHCESISYMPASAPPSFRTIPSCIIARASCRSSQTLPSYVSACHSPPKYEQAIVTQIRDQPESVIVQHDPRYSNDMLSS